MSSSLLVAVAAVLISLASLALAVRADRRASRAELRSLRARIAVEPTHSALAARGRLFELRVRNVGAGTARGVRVWLEDEAGRVVSSVAGGPELTLAPGEETMLAVTAREDALPPPPVSFPVLVSYVDGIGAHERENAGTAST